MNCSKICSSVVTNFLIILAKLKYHHGRSVHLLALYMNQGSLRCLNMNGTADESNHVPMNGTRSNHTVQNLGEMPSSIGLCFCAVLSRS